MRVLCNGKTLAFQANDTGSIPVTRSKYTMLVAFRLRSNLLLWFSVEPKPCLM
jgi:hypothetical protein